MPKNSELLTKLDKRSLYLRSLVVDCLLGGGRGHMGSAMSLIEILRVLYDEILKFNPKKPRDDDRDRLILSKGHGCLALYAILSDKKFFNKNILKTSSRFNSILGGHPEYGKVQELRLLQASRSRTCNRSRYGDVCKIKNKA